MAWFGDTFGESLSSIKGQLSKITKDVLTDDSDGASEQGQKLRELEEKCRQLMDDCFRKDAEIRELNEERISLKDALDEIDMTHQKELDIILKDREQLSQRLKLLENVSTDGEDNVSLCDRQVHERERDLEEQLRQLNLKLKEYENFDGFAEVSLQSSSNNHKRNESTLENDCTEILELKEQVFHLHNQLKEAEDFVKETKKQLQLKMNENDNILREGESLRKILDEKEVIIIDLRKEMEAKELVNGELQSTIEELKQNLLNSEDMVSKKIKNLLEEKVMLNEENEKKFTEIIKNEETKSKELYEENISLKNQLISLSSCNKEMEQEINFLKTKISEMETPSGDEALRREIDTLNRTIETLRADHTERNNANLLKLKNIILTLGAEMHEEASDISKVLSEVNLRISQIVEENREQCNMVKQMLHSEIHRLKTLVDRIQREFLLRDSDSFNNAPQTSCNTSSYEMSQTDDMKQLKQDFSHMNEIIRQIDQGLTEVSQWTVSQQKEQAVLKSVLAKTDKELQECYRMRDTLEKQLQSVSGAVKNLETTLLEKDAEKQQLMTEFHNKASKLKEMEQMQSIMLEENKKLKFELKDSIERISKLEHQLTASPKEEDLTALREKNSELEKSISESAAHKKSNENVGELKDSLDRLLEENSNLKLLVQQLREGIIEINSHEQRKQLENDQKEVENTLRKELERLRKHLVEVEDHYTTEAVKTEKIISELKSKLETAEETLRNSSNKYKSANIRSTQHVESLESQIRLMSVQRDDLQAKLSVAEDQVQKHVASLASLQMVLEQFQLDKERELEAVATKFEYQLELARRSSLEVERELQVVKEQLLEARSGLLAASRLGEQIDRKNEKISQMEEELQQLRDSLEKCDSQLREQSQVTSERIDKSLVKNLLLRYVTASHQTHKEQGLRILASVVDASPEERALMGLEASSGGWFSGFIQPRADRQETNLNESLSQAFIRFLENESKPKPQIPLLPRQQKTDIEPRSLDRRKSPLLESDLLSGSNAPTQLEDVLKSSENRLDS